ncbi:2Fe-2S iron-sulfur cluster binding domain-containing protein [Duganella sp. FT80W]|uniref:2Fe-2S iron-sulfur cluster binding domain-containing protein n=1 Tax=Duganella guangzhouensis TaxID=2666084 RepID=A0A6I2KZ75_9BURK|nr:PDR/VanB family oxidoreductase [Duganella guangzhouensis]MRW89774.1 2Fe-2S iron-sulfur cluster binding domain-containing protein [Duganella guangzhouensis]
MELINVRIASKTMLAVDIAGFELVAADGGALPPFSAGAHIDVHIGPGLVRQYSLCNAPGETRRYQIAVLREPASRGGSRAMHDRLQVGDTLRISAPRNHFPLQAARRTLLFAGGIGITPILSMASQLARDGSVFALHYCARSASRAAFAGAAAGFGKLYLDDGGDKMDLPALLSEPDADTHLYVCGPAGFIDYVTGTARSLGWAPDRVHQEYFAGAAVDTSGDSSFEVLLASSGKVVPVAAHQSIVQALATQGVEIEVSCEQGVCGTCVTRVLDGVPDHRDSYFTDAEKRANDQCTPCCSRALSARLVLDL